MKDNIRELANALVKVEHLAQIEGVWAFSSYDGPTKVQMDRGTFEKCFEGYKTEPYTPDNAKLSYVVNGIEFFTLAQYEQEAPQLRKLKKLED